MQIELGACSGFAATGGKPFDPARPAMVFLHGAGLDNTVWALHSRWFAFHGWSVLAVDLPGHGRSPGSPLASIGSMADWVLELAARAGAQQHVLVGHSMGALVALEAAARAPERAAGLALIGAAARMPVHRDLLAAARANEHSALDMLNLWGHGGAAALGGHEAPGIWMLGSGIRLFERAAPGVVFADLSACNAYAGAAAAAARVRCPTLLICGERDRMTPLAGGRELAALISGAQLAVVAQAGHMLLAERPIETREMLARFFSARVADGAAPAPASLQEREKTS